MYFTWAQILCNLILLQVMSPKEIESGRERDTEQKGARYLIILHLFIYSDYILSIDYSIRHFS